MQANWGTEGHLQRQINELQSLLEQARKELHQLRAEAQGLLRMIEFLLKLLLEHDDEQGRRP